MITCSPEAFAKCPTHQYCGSSAGECTFSEGSACDIFNQHVEAHASAEKVDRPEGVLQGKEMLAVPDFCDPSQWRRYEFEICRNSQALANVLDKINKNGWALVTVTQDQCERYTVFYKRFLSCQKKDDV
jgi:hypothetical protein